MRVLAHLYTYILSQYSTKLWENRISIYYLYQPMNVELHVGAISVGLSCTVHCYTDHIIGRNT